MARFVRRKWGFYIVLLDYSYFKVKLLRFKKDSELSLQYHNNRNELWLFLNGMGNLIIDDRKVLLGEGEWFNIIQGMNHKFRALWTTYVLEIQYGESCTEDDIVRI